MAMLSNISRRRIHTTLAMREDIEERRDGMAHTFRLRRCSAKRTDWGSNSNHIRIGLFKWAVGMF